MKARYAFAVFLPMLVAATGLAQSRAVQNDPMSNSASMKDDATLLGVWRAQADGLPSVTIHFTNDGGTLSGAALFYLHVREHGGPVTVTPGVPEPLLNLHFDGKALTFQVSHRHAHAPASLSTPPVRFRMDLTAPDRASLVNESEPVSSSALVRSDF